MLPLQHSPKEARNWLHPTTPKAPAGPRQGGTPPCRAPTRLEAAHPRRQRFLDGQVPGPASGAAYCYWPSPLAPGLSHRASLRGSLRLHRLHMQARAPAHQVPAPLGGATAQRPPTWRGPATQYGPSPFAFRAPRTRDRSSTCSKARSAGAPCSRGRSSTSPDHLVPGRPTFACCDRDPLPSPKGFLKQSNRAKLLDAAV